MAVFYPLQKWHLVCFVCLLKESIRMILGTDVHKVIVAAFAFENLRVLMGKI